MSGRWVCPRCYESNDADVSQCARCGLERGADPSQAAQATEGDASSTQQAWAPPVATQRQRPAWQQLLLRFGWVGVAIAIAVGGVILNAKRDDAGQITGGGNLQVQDLRIGDCFNLKDESADNVSDVDAKPCTEAHRYELFQDASLAEGAYPASDQLKSYAEQECLGAFLSYIGTTYQNSVLEVVYFTPTSDAWGNGDRSVQCAAYDPAQATLTGSLKGARR